MPLGCFPYEEGEEGEEDEGEGCEGEDDVGFGEFVANLNNCDIVFNIIR